MTNAEYDIAFAKFMERIMPDYRKGAQQSKEREAKGIRPRKMSDDEHDDWIEKLEGWAFEERGR